MAGPPDVIPTTPQTTTTQSTMDPARQAALGSSLGGNALLNSTPGYSSSTGGNMQNLEAAGGIASMQGTGMAPGYNAPTAAVGGNQTAGFQYGMADAGAIDQSKIDPAQMPNMSVQGHQPYDQEMLNAYYGEAQKRLDPQWDQRQHDLETQAQNMGLTRGSEAWNREMQNMSGQRNDAYGSAMNQAILNSGAEGQRAQNMDIAAGNFGNQATQQNFQNQLTSQTQQNAQQNQQYTQNLGSAQLANAGLTAQQQAAQGWKSIDAANKASELGYQGTIGAANAAAGASMSNARLQGSLEERRIQDAEAQQKITNYWQGQHEPALIAKDYANVYGTPTATMPTVNTPGADQMQKGVQGGQDTIGQAVGDAAGGKLPGQIWDAASKTWKNMTTPTGSLGGDQVGQGGESYYGQG